MSRHLTTTVKISSSSTGLRGALFVHAEHTQDGRVEHISFSNPGRFDNTQIARVIEQIEIAVNEAIADER